MRKLKFRIIRLPSICLHITFRKEPSTISQAELDTAEIHDTTLESRLQ